MRRLLAIAFLAALPAAAQIHGVPPSVSSWTPGRMTPGVPASVMSLGPNGFGSRWSSPSHFTVLHQRHFHHRRVVAVFVPYYAYPYYSSYAERPSTAEYDDTADRPRDDYFRDEDRYGAHFTDSREQERQRRREEDERQAKEEREKEAQKAGAKAESKPQDPEPATVLVFKDGHHQDVAGYAISGEVLYDLSHGRAKKILLADLDLPATIKLNDELGNDFRLPSRPPKQN